MLQVLFIQDQVNGDMSSAWGLQQVTQYFHVCKQIHHNCYHLARRKEGWVENQRTVKISHPRELRFKLWIKHSDLLSWWVDIASGPLCLKALTPPWQPKSLKKIYEDIPHPATSCLICHSQKEIAERLTHVHKLCLSLMHQICVALSNYARNIAYEQKS